jgi:hypothetical protein
MKKLALVLAGVCAIVPLVNCGKADSSQSTSPTSNGGMRKPDAASNDGPRKSEAPPVAALKVTTEDIMSAYDEGNLIAADEKYKGKLVELTGMVVGVEKNTFGGINVHLEDKRRGVKCVLPTALKDQVLGLQTGDEVTVRGECRGKILGHILVEKCESVRVVPKKKE